MLIVNADDWGRSEAETEAARVCYTRGRITSATAMVFMADSERAADVAREIGIDVGLHLNLSQPFNGNHHSEEIRRDQGLICRFLRRGKYAVLLYHPFLRNAFRRAFQAQLDEFRRLYGRTPSHIDGHQHKHLCANIVLGCVIPRGAKVRRNFSFRAGEKGVVNRCYRRLTDALLARRYRLTDYFFSLGRCLDFNEVPTVAESARRRSVELMAHPGLAREYNYLLSDDFAELKKGVELGTYAML